MAVDVVSHLTVLHTVPREHAYVSAALTVAVVQMCADCDNVAVGTERHRMTALVFHRFAVDVVTALRPIFGVSVEVEHAHVTAVAVLVSRTDREYETVGAHRHRPAVPVALIVSKQRGHAVAQLVLSVVPRVHAHLSSGSLLVTTFALWRTDCKHTSVGAHRHRMAAPVARRLAVDVVASRTPVRAVPRVHAHVAAVHTIVVIFWRTNREHESVGAHRHRPAAQVGRRLAVKVVATRLPVCAVPLVDAHMAVTVVIMCTNREHQAIGAQRQ